MAFVDFRKHDEIEQGQTKYGGRRRHEVGCRAEEMNGRGHRGGQQTWQDNTPFAISQIQKLEKAGVDTHH